jgi:release factor glutamine methyltransferase
MSILEVIQRSTDFLARKGVASPRLQVELLLAHLLRMPRMKLYLSFERVLTSMELDALRALVLRRGQREPLQYIVASTSFCGLEIALSRGVLIPRPETELLAERAWTFLQKGAGVLSALEIGTGSGCLAIALARHALQATICATDLSGPALELARRNAEANLVSDRVQFFQGDLFAAAPAEARYDLIVSNPPYIPTARIETLEAEVRDYEPRSALDGGTDGQDFYRRIAAEAGARLQPAGCLMLELDEEGAAATRQIFQSQKWIVEGVEKDYNGRDRILIARPAARSQDADCQTMS